MSVIFNIFDIWVFYPDILSFDMDFQDPASPYMESLVNMHNEVMYYIILILTTVYLVLYFIIKDSSWTTFNRQVGFLRIYLRTKVSLVINFIYLYFYAGTWIIWFFYTFETKNDIAYLIPPLKGFVNELDFFLKVLFFDLDTPGRIRPYMWWYHSDDRPWYNYYFSFYRAEFLYAYLFGYTTRGYRDYGRVTGYDTLLTFKFSPFLKLQQFKHSTLLEVIWAAFPSVVILLILVPSILLIYSVDDQEVDPFFTVKVIGHQWFWSFELSGWLPVVFLDSEGEAPWLEGRGGELALNMFWPKKDEVEFFSYEFDSCLITTDSLEPGQFRLLEVDNPLYIPTGIGMRFLITSYDVLHSFSVPSLGIKVDAVPGRLSQITFLADRPGVFYGQCSEICGVGHGFMPTVVEARSISKLTPIYAHQKLSVKRFVMFGMPLRFFSPGNHPIQSSKIIR